MANKDYEYSVEENLLNIYYLCKLALKNDKVMDYLIKLPG